MVLNTFDILIKCTHTYPLPRKWLMALEQWYLASIVHSWVLLSIWSRTESIDKSILVFYSRSRRQNKLICQVKAACFSLLCCRCKKEVRKWFFLVWLVFLWFFKLYHLRFGLIILTQKIYHSLPLAIGNRTMVVHLVAQFSHVIYSACAITLGHKQCTIQIGVLVLSILEHYFPLSFCQIVVDKRRLHLLSWFCHVIYSLLNTISIWIAPRWGQTFHVWQKFKTHLWPIHT